MADLTREQIIAIQRGLVEFGELDPQGITGQFDGDTVRSVARTLLYAQLTPAYKQASGGKAPDGQYNPNTQIGLDAAATERRLQLQMSDGTVTEEGYTLIPPSLAAAIKNAGPAISQLRIKPEHLAPLVAEVQAEIAADSLDAALLGFAVLPPQAQTQPQPQLGAQPAGSQPPSAPTSPPPPPTGGSPPGSGQRDPHASPQPSFAQAQLAKILPEQLPGGVSRDEAVQWVEDHPVMASVAGGAAVLVPTVIAAKTLIGAGKIVTAPFRGGGGGSSPAPGAPGQNALLPPAALMEANALSRHQRTQFFKDANEYHSLTPQQAADNLRSHWWQGQRAQADLAVRQRAYAWAQHAANPVSSPAPTPYAPPPRATFGSRAGKGVAVAGVVQGGISAYQSYQQGDGVGVGLGSATALTSAANLFGVAKKVVGRAAVPLMIIDGARQVYNQEGNFVETNADGSHSLGDKSNRALLVGGTTLGTAGLVAAGVGTAPVTLTVGTVAYIGSETVDMIAARRQATKLLNTNAKGVKLTSIAGQEGAAPSIKDYKHLPFVLSDISADIKDGNLDGKVQRTKSGIIPPEELLKLDAGKPKNQKEIERVIAENIKKQETIIAEQQKIADQNTSFVGDTLGFWKRKVGFTHEAGDARDKAAKSVSGAKVRLSSLQAAAGELELYKKDAKEHKEKLPKQANAPGGATAITAPASGHTLPVPASLDAAARLVSQQNLAAHQVQTANTGGQMLPVLNDPQNLLRLQNAMNAEIQQQQGAFAKGDNSQERTERIRALIYGRAEAERYRTALAQPQPNTPATVPSGSPPAAVVSQPPPSSQAPVAADATPPGVWERGRRLVNMAVDLTMGRKPAAAAPVSVQASVAATPPPLAALPPVPPVNPPPPAAKSPPALVKPPATAAAPETLLAKEKVLEIQQALVKTGYLDKSLATGVINEDTRELLAKAVAMAQQTEAYKQAGGTIDDLYGPKTQKAIESMASNALTNKFVNQDLVTALAGVDPRQLRRVVDAPFVALGREMVVKMASSEPEFFQKLQRVGLNQSQPAAPPAAPAATVVVANGTQPPPGGQPDPAPPASVTTPVQQTTAPVMLPPPPLSPPMQMLPQSAPRVTTAPPAGYVRHPAAQGGIPIVTAAPGGAPYTPEQMNAIHHRAQDLEKQLQAWSNQVATAPGGQRQSPFGSITPAAASPSLRNALQNLRTTTGTTGGASSSRYSTVMRRTPPPTPDAKPDKAPPSTVAVAGQSSDRNSFFASSLVDTGGPA